MPAYVFGIRNKLVDEERYQQYSEAAMPTLEGRDASFLAAYGQHRVLEGDEAEGAFVLEFPTFAEAEAWFDSKEYQDAAALRAGAADYRIVMVDGLQPTETQPGHGGDADVDDIRELITEWALVGWRHLETDPPYVFRDRLGKFYDWESSDVILHDNADAQRRVTTSAAEYAAIWDEMVPSLKTLSNRLLGEPDIMVEGNLALVSVKFASRFEGADGTVDEAPTLSSLVLRRGPDGWKIFREHGSSLVPDPD